MSVSMPTIEDFEYDYDEVMAQSTCASEDSSEIRKLAADLIANARKEFPTRAELEDSIVALQIDIDEAANYELNAIMNRVRDSCEQTQKRAELAQEKMHKLIPLRLVLQTAADLTDLVTVLQMQKECETRNFDVEKAWYTQLEIDEIEDQIETEERYTLAKRLEQTNRAELTEKKIKGILKVASKKRSGSPVSVAVVDSIRVDEDDEESVSASTVVSTLTYDQLRPHKNRYDACGIANIFGW